MHRVKQTFWRVAAGVMVLAVIAGSAFAARRATPRHGVTGAQAKQIAQKYVGIESLKGITATVAATVPHDDQSPFLHSLINGHRCYLVTFSGVTVKVAWGENEERVAPIHRIYVLLDAASGKFLKAWSLALPNDPTEGRPAADVEASIHRTDSERWTGLPDVSPKVTLLAVMRSREAWILGYIEQFEAYYVMSKKTIPSRTTVRPTLELMVRQRGISFFPDITPLPAPGSPPPPPPKAPDPNQVYLWRLAVDADTGQVVDSSNAY